MTSRLKKMLKNIETILGYLPAIPPDFTSHSKLTILCNLCGVDWSCEAVKLCRRNKIHQHLTAECKACSHKISRAKVKETNLVRYGGHHMKKQEFKNKIASTNLVRYGGVAPAASSEVRAKMLATNLERSGVGNGLGARQQAAIKAKALKERGVEHHLADPKVKAKMAETLQARYGVQNPAQNPEFIRKAILTKKQSLKTAEAADSNQTTHVDLDSTVLENDSRRRPS